MPPHSSILAWEIPWTEKPGGIQSMGWQKNWTQLLNSSNKQQQKKRKNCMPDYNYSAEILLSSQYAHKEHMKK